MRTVTVTGKNPTGKRLVNEHGRNFEVTGLSPRNASALLWCPKSCKCGGGHVQRVTLGVDVDAVALR